MAEKEGFEPSIPFWGIHDFQSCALGQLRDFSMSCSVHAVSKTAILQLSPFVKGFFQIFHSVVYSSVTVRRFMEPSI